MTQEYAARVDLLLQLIPFVAKEEMFGLYGGTAINYFIFDMPRLSVDIDLTYLPLDDRQTALKNISEALSRIKATAEKSIKGLTVNLMPTNSIEAKLNCQLKGAQVKIEVNTVARGHIYPLKILNISEKINNEFNRFAKINVFSYPELYAGKICAALGRQHPRDLFDIDLLFKNGGITEDIKNCFLAALIRDKRPMNELIQPHILDQRAAYQNQFVGMTEQAFSYSDFENTRAKLIQDINSKITQKDKEFLISFKKGSPDWTIAPIPNLHKFPAINWKLENIKRLITENPAKHNLLLNELEIKLGIKSTIIIPKVKDILEVKSKGKSKGMSM